MAVALVRIKDGKSAVIRTVLSPRSSATSPTFPCKISALGKHEHSHILRLFLIRISCAGLNSTPFVFLEFKVLDQVRKEDL